MKTLSFLTPIILILITSHSLLAEESPDQVLIQLEPSAVENLRLSYSPAVSSEIGETIQGAGTVQLNESKVAEVTPKIDGVISDISVALGDTVKKGDPLCTLQSAELSGLISNYVAIEEQMTFAAAALSQEKKLAEQNLTSAEQLREKEAAFKQAVTGHARALQPLKLLNFNEATIHAYLHNVHESDYTSLELEALEAGEIIEMDVRKGAAVEHNTHLFTIADLSQLWVDFYVPLKSASALEVGATVKVSSTVSEKVRKAEIIYIAPVADARNRTVMVRALMSNSDRAWRPGNPVDVMASSQTGSKILAVPRSAVVDFGGEKVVFVKQGEGEFRLTPVQVGQSDDASFAILGGLELGETVVSKNAAQLKGHLEMTASE
ncbi:MAG: efflux RND transporter periplasmic adaptor subunit [Verrucomicrobiales bacterium]|nr:efflux RND transporter periplasmic adaptor subunit [Verrucomicrobiales bacterium]